MNDLIIFGMGLFVTLMVSGAVGLLLWGAAQEPAAGEVPEDSAWSGATPSENRATVTRNREEATRSEHAA